MGSQLSADTPRASLGARHRSLGRAVQDQLRAAIINGEYTQGSRLVEEEIAADLDVSRNPIREALHALAAEGFVVLEPRRGARVATVDGQRARDLFELRGSLEGLVCGLAAMRRTDEQVATLRAIVIDGRDAIARGQLDVLPGLNTTFHLTLAVAAGNELLANTLGRLSDVIRWVYAARISKRSTKSWDEHAAIVDAVADGDTTQAQRCGIGHIAAAAEAHLGPGS